MIISVQTAGLLIKYKSEPHLLYGQVIVYNCLLCHWQRMGASAPHCPHGSAAYASYTKKVQSKFTSIAKLVQLCYNIIQLLSLSLFCCSYFVVVVVVFIVCPCFAVVVILLVIVNCFVYQLLLCHKQHGIVFFV